MPLYTLKKKASCTIKSLPAIKLLHSMGLREGLPVSVVTKQPFGGPIVVQIGSRCIALGKDIAEQIEISLNEVY
ncbi:FeoA family protein [Desulfuribacillus alkaliarsenatis]|uniref:Iron transporter FeoA n=1 Tax=Desulfuribacillus alkaliarsenatis TaxID=766136 RepID=A0A1E5G3W0_9FIRM|nr:FeoA family protein [Desulfuribacillus alkaliarsenatis]OEF97765.1 iron transporter FeoA [Desulfuribacillus alkaliarsenatis]